VSGQSADRATVAAIGAVVYIAANIIHEHIGHVGMDLIFGIPPAVIASTHVVPSRVPAAAWQQAAVAAAGGLANLAAALVALALFRATPRTCVKTAYVLWLAFSVNAFLFGSYMAASAVFGFGDWNEVVHALGDPTIWAAVLALVGLATCRIAFRTARSGLSRFLGSEPVLRRQTAVTLTHVPWITGGVIAAVAGAIGRRPLAIDLAYALGWGLGATVWLRFLGQRAEFSVAPQEPEPLRRSMGWIVSGLVVTTVFVAVLGPGVKLREVAPATTQSETVTVRGET
jgi:hypothetical protein